jgi:Zn-finger nucleic acid-binding protein
MQCPVCDVTLTISSREGVEIDFCPPCRGVWLDRGELDKVIDRASVVLETARMAPPPDRDQERGRYDERPRPSDRDRYPERDRYDDRERYDDRGDRKRKKKRGFDMLEDLFDF